MKTCTCMAFIRIISGISRLHWQYRLCALKLKTIHKCFLCPYKRQISVLRLTALRGVRAHKNVAHFQHKLNVIYSDRCYVVELLLQLKSKQQSMPNNVETQHKHMYSLYIGSLCNITFLWHSLPASWLQKCSWKSECNEA